MWIPQGGPKRSGQSVDGSGQHSGDPGGELATRIYNKILAEPELQGLDEQKLKRVYDELKGALSGFSTSPKEDALLEQSSSPEDEYYKQEIARLKKMPGLENIDRWTTDQQRDLIDSVNAASEGRPFVPRAKQRQQSAQPQRKPFAGDDEYLNDPEKWNRERKKL